MQAAGDDRSLGSLLGDLAGQTAALVRGELAIARAELTKTATQTGKDVGQLLIGGAVVYAGFLVLLAAAVLGLATVLAAWLAAVIVGLIVLAVGVRAAATRACRACPHEPGPARDAGDAGGRSWTC